MLEIKTIEIPIGDALKFADEALRDAVVERPGTTAGFVRIQRPSLVPLEGYVFIDGASPRVDVNADTGLPSKAVRESFWKDWSNVVGCPLLIVSVALKEAGLTIRWGRDIRGDASTRISVDFEIGAPELEDVVLAKKAYGRVFSVLGLTGIDLVDVNEGEFQIQSDGKDCQVWNESFGNPETYRRLIKPKNKFGGVNPRGVSCYLFGIESSDAVCNAGERLVNEFGGGSGEETSITASFLSWEGYESSRQVLSRWGVGNWDISFFSKSRYSLSELDRWFASGDGGVSRVMTIKVPGGEVCDVEMRCSDSGFAMKAYLEDPSDEAEAFVSGKLNAWAGRSIIDTREL